MGLALALALLTLAGTHVTLAVRLAMRRPWWRGPLGLLVAPLAPWWGWQAGLRVEAVVWGSALGLYALGVGLTGR